MVCTSNRQLLEMGTTVSTDRETSLGEVKEEIKQNGTPSLNGISEKTPTLPDSQEEGEAKMVQNGRVPAKLPKAQYESPYKRPKSAGVIKSLEYFDNRTHSTKTIVGNGLLTESESPKKDPEEKKEAQDNTKVREDEAKKIEYESPYKRPKSCLKTNGSLQNSPEKVMSQKFRSRSVSPRKRAVSFNKSSPKTTKQMSLSVQEIRSSETPKHQTPQHYSQPTISTKMKSNKKSGTPLKRSTSMGSAADMTLQEAYNETLSLSEQIKSILETPSPSAEKGKNKKKMSKAVKSKTFSDQNIVKTPKRKSEFTSLIENPETNPMNPVEQKPKQKLEKEDTESLMQSLLQSLKESDEREAQRKYPIEPSTPALTLRIQNTRSSKLRLRSAKTRIQMYKNHEDKHLGPLY